MDENKPIPFHAEEQKNAPVQTGPAQEPTKLHFCRVRGKEDAMFFDPQTDIRKLLPDIMEDALQLITLESDNEEHAARVENIRKCLYVFRLRLLEDPTPYARQLELFDKAIRATGEDIVQRFYAAIAHMLIALFGLFMRRDSRADENALRSMLHAAEASSLLSRLPESVKKTVTDSLMANPSLEVREGANLALEKRAITHNATAICLETGKLLQSLRGKARRYISVTGPASWEDLAAACDREFSNPNRNLPTDATISVALAYPTYEAPNLEVVCDAEDAGEVK